jgi:hypothetical protein
MRRRYERLLHPGLLGLVALNVFLLSLNAPDVRSLDLVHLRFTVLGLALVLVGGRLLQSGGLLVGALEGAIILEGVGVLGVVVVVAVVRVAGVPNPATALAPALSRTRMLARTCAPPTPASQLPTTALAALELRLQTPA